MKPACSPLTIDKPASRPLHPQPTFTPANQDVSSGHIPARERAGVRACVRVGPRVLMQIARSRVRWGTDLAKSESVDVY